MYFPSFKGIRYNLKPCLSCVQIIVSAFKSIFTLYFFYSYKNASVPRFSTITTAKILNQIYIFNKVFLLLHICLYDSETMVSRFQIFTHARIIYLHIMLEKKKYSLSWPIQLASKFMPPNSIESENTRLEGTARIIWSHLSWQNSLDKVPASCLAKS